MTFSLTGRFRGLQSVMYFNYIITGLLWSSYRDWGHPTAFLKTSCQFITEHICHTHLRLLCLLTAPSRAFCKTRLNETAVHLSSQTNPEGDYSIIASLPVSTSFHVLSHLKSNLHDQISSIFPIQKKNICRYLESNHMPASCHESRIYKQEQSHEQEYFANKKKLRETQRKQIFY